MSDRTKSRPPRMLAPGASKDASSFPGPPTSFDDHLVTPELTRDEVVRGEVMEALPANPDHGDPHSRLDYVLSAHLLPGYVASADLLTRFNLASDFASDVSIRKEGNDPATGKRFLEELAFEVVSTQPLMGKGGITPKAREMVAAGVRRVFGIFVPQGKSKEGTVKEWVGRWQGVGLSISDPCFARPVPVGAILYAAEADNAVARALVAKGNPVIEEVRQAAERLGREAGERLGREAGERLGRVDGIRSLQDTILLVLSTRGVTPSPAVEARIRAIEDLWVLQQLVARAATVSDLADLRVE